MHRQDLDEQCACVLFRQVVEYYLVAGEPIAFPPLLPNALVRVFVLQRKGQIISLDIDFKLKKVPLELMIH